MLTGRGRDHKILKPTRRSSTPAPTPSGTIHKDRSAPRALRPFFVITKPNVAVTLGKVSYALGNE